MICGLGDIMDNLLTWLARGLFLMAGLLFIAGNAGLFISAPTFWDGLNRFWEVNSPFNIINWFLFALTLAPGYLVLAWRDKRRDKTRV